MDQCIPITTVRNRTVKKRTCPTCNKEFLTNHFNRHVRTCKGLIINGQRQCRICLKWMRGNNIPRHFASKHKGEDPTLPNVYEISQLREENMKLQYEKRKLLLHKKNKNYVNRPMARNHPDADTTLSNVYEISQLRDENRNLILQSAGTIAEKDDNKKRSKGTVTTKQQRIANKKKYNSEARSRKLQYRTKQLRVSNKNNLTVKSLIELPHSECSYLRPTFTPEHRARILDSQGNVCAMCKFKPTHIQIFTTMAVDHIKEKQELGYFDNSRDNLQVLCYSCNNSKARDLSWELKQKATKLRKDKKFKRQLEYRRLESISISSTDGSSSESDSY